MLESTAEEAICYTAELETWEDASFAEDGTPLVSYSYTLPTLRAAREDGTVIEHAETPAEEQALAMAAAFNDRFSTWVTTEDFEGLTGSTGGFGLAQGGADGVDKRVCAGAGLQCLSNRASNQCFWCLL